MRVAVDVDVVEAEGEAFANVFVFLIVVLSFDRPEDPPFWWCGCPDWWPGRRHPGHPAGIMGTACRNQGTSWCPNSTLTKMPSRTSHTCTRPSTNPNARCRSDTPRKVIEATVCRYCITAMGIPGTDRSQIRTEPPVDPDAMSERPTARHVTHPSCAA